MNKLHKASKQIAKYRLYTLLILVLFLYILTWGNDLVPVKLIDLAPTHNPKHYNREFLLHCNAL